MKHFIFFISILLYSLTSFSYTLNNNFGASFDKKTVKVQIAGNTTCSTAGVTIYELQDLIRPSIDDFWNRIPTSSLRLTEGGFTDAINNINLGRLCSPTDTTCISNAGGNLIPEINDIVIACNNNPDNYNGNNVLAVTIPNHFKGKKIKGSVILINNGSAAFSNLSRADKIGVISHEIGHAIGLGHSEDSAAMMFYRTVDLRKSLGQDDIDGVSYLYPVNLPGDGCGILGGTIKSNDDTSSHLWQMGIGFFLFLLIWKLKNYLKLVPRRAHSAS